MKFKNKLQFLLVLLITQQSVFAQQSDILGRISDAAENIPLEFVNVSLLKQDSTFITGVAYGQSKTASNLFALELDNRAKAFNVRAYSLHPGSIAGTELGREASLELFIKMGFVDEEGNMRPEVLASLKTIPQGAATTVWCATTPLLNNIGGVYCEDVEVALLASDSGMSAGVKCYSLDEAEAKRLWKWSEETCGISFSII